MAYTRGRIKDQMIGQRFSHLCGEKAGVGIG
jgi:hypothetical protein